MAKWLEAVAQLTKGSSGLIVMTTASYMAGVRDGELTCLRHGANVISLSDRNLHSWLASPQGGFLRARNESTLDACVEALTGADDETDHK